MPRIKPLSQNQKFGSEIIRLVSEIDEFKGRWEALKRLAPERLDGLRRIATIESIGASTRIEGARLSDVEVETLLSRLDMRSLATRDEQEVAGYAGAMALVFENHAEMRLTENTIRQLHGTLLTFSEKDERHRGDYKTLRNDLVAFDARNAPIGIVFPTASPFDTPRRMEELVSWTAKALAEQSHHPLLVIGAFVVQFLAIHPFQDGNGRLSRVLTMLLLLRSGYAYAPYASLERVIEANKDHYYAALRRTQTTLEDDGPDWESWLGFFLRALKRQKDGLAARIERERALESERAGMDGAGGALSTRILTLFDAASTLGIGQIERLTQANRNTIKVHLRALVAQRRLVRHGQGRASRYSRAGG